VRCLRRNRLRAETAVSLTRFQYECLTCESFFVAVRRMKTARCVHCGSLSTELRRMTSDRVQDPTPQLVRPDDPGLPQPRCDGEDLVSKYLCLDCGRPTRWNHTRKRGQDPVCSSCSSASVKEASPRVTMIAVLRGTQRQSKVPLTKSEIKRIKFVRRQWRMRCELTDQVERLTGLLDRLGFEGEKITAARETMARLLVEVDAKQQERLVDYSR